MDLTLRGQHLEAGRLVRANAHGQAMAICRRVLEAYPRHIKTYSTLGQICLELGEHEMAANLFRRMLSADPEHALSYASLGAIYEERGLRDEAVWQLERALEISPSNVEIRRELCRLYGESRPFSTPRAKMTRGALARAYLRGRLFPKAVGELRDLVREEPNRFDLRVALAEGLWHSARYGEAELVSAKVLAQLPNCLKGNLILGKLWLNTDRDAEARTLLQRAQALDPDNAVAQALFGSLSPLPPRVARLPMRETDHEPLDLPYLNDDDDLESDARTVDGSAVPRSDTSGLDLIAASTVTRETMRPRPAQGSRSDRPGPPDTARLPVRLATVRVPQPAPSMEKMKDRGSEPQPSVSWETRMDIARRLGSVGAVKEAVKEYVRVLQGAPEQGAQVVEEVRLLNRLHPGEVTVVALLSYAQDLARAVARPTQVTATVA